jgi:hypothetical protein
LYMNEIINRFNVLWKKIENLFTLNKLDLYKTHVQHVD